MRGARWRRAVAAATLVLALVVVAVLLTSGSTTHRYDAVFQTAGQLVKGDDVQIGGLRAGSITAIELDDRHQAVVSFDLDDRFAPLHRGTSAVIRLTSLSGVANRYIALSPGPNNGTEIDDGGTIGAQDTTTPVDLDQIFDTLDGPTRRHLQQVFQGSAVQYKGREALANASARYISPALSSTQRVANELDRNSATLRDFLVSSSRVVDTLAARRGRLSGLVTHAGQTADAFAADNRALGQGLDLLPRTLRRANTTFVNLRSTLDAVDPLVTASKPATRRLAPVLAELRPFVAAARPTIADLRRLVRTDGPDNDLIDALAKLPRLSEKARPTFAHSAAAFRRTVPVLGFARPYVPGLVGWLRDFGQGGSNYDANGHYARVEAVTNQFDLSDNPGGVPALTPRPSGNEGTLSTGNLRRCPGTASQAPPDGSAPFTDSGADGYGDCDPKQIVPGGTP